MREHNDPPRASGTREQHQEQQTSGSYSSKPHLSTAGRLLPDGIRRGFRMPFSSRRAAQSELDEELAFHMDMTIRELEAAGHSPDEARRIASERFGNINNWRTKLMSEDIRRSTRVKRADRWETLTSEAARLLRGFVRAPAFTLGVVLTLAIGISANATMVGIVDRLLLRAPEGVANAESVNLVWKQIADEQSVGNVSYFSYPAYEHLRSEVPGFESLAAYAFRNLITGTGQDAAELTVGVATGSYFSTLGTRPAAGRLFVSDEGESGSTPNVIVLSSELWHSRYGASDSAIGQTMVVGGQQMTIIGVLPEGMGSLQLGRVDAWVPLAAIPSLGLGDSWESNNSWHWLRIVGRVAPGVERPELEQQLSVAMLDHERSLASDETPDISADISGLVYGVNAASGPEEATSVTVARWLAGMSVVLLLIACANVANLLLVRGMRRQRETALRVALGVSPGRLVLSSLTEALVLAVAGGALALLLTRWAGALVRTVLFPSMSWPDHVFDVRIALITAVAILATALAAGLAPALRAVRADALPSLQGGHRAGNYQRSRLRTGLLITQSALSVLLLVGAGLFVSSLNHARNADLGFEPSSVAVVSLPLFRTTVPVEEWALVTQAVREALLLRPEVGSVALSNSVPQMSTVAYGVSSPGLNADGTSSAVSLVHAVTHDFFSTMGLRLVEGRLFNETESRLHLAVINQSSAQYYFPAGDAIGGCIRLSDDDSEPCNTVIGVVADMKWEGLSEEANRQVFIPSEREGHRVTFMLVGLHEPPGTDMGSLGHSLRQTAMSAEPRLDWADVQSLTSILAPDYQSWRLGATMFSAFGLIALLLAAIGLYSALSYMVAQRKHDVGVRRALGASGARVAGAIVVQGVAVVSAGIALGLLVAVAAAGLLEGLLFEVAPREPAVLAATALVLLVVSVLACSVPAVRAARVSPMEALRE